MPHLFLPLMQWETVPQTKANELMNTRGDLALGNLNPKMLCKWFNIAAKIQEYEVRLFSSLFQGVFLLCKRYTAWFPPRSGKIPCSTTQMVKAYLLETRWGFGGSKWRIESMIAWVQWQQYPKRSGRNFNDWVRFSLITSQAGKDVQPWTAVGPQERPQSWRKATRFISSAEHLFGIIDRERVLARYSFKALTATS